MTRDEALTKVVEPDAGYDFQFALIDSLVALGILKLDEPKSALAKLKSRLVGDFGYSHSSHAILDLEAALTVAGLKVVEK